MRTRTRTKLLTATTLAVLAPAPLAMGLPITADLQVHLAADAGITESGGSVSEWESQASNALTMGALTPDFEPTLVTNIAGLNNQSAVEFSQADNPQFMLGEFDNTFDGNALTIFMVGKLEESTFNTAYNLAPVLGNNGISLARAGVVDEVFAFHWDGDGTGSTRLQSGTGGTTPPAPKLDDAYHILVLQIDKSTASMDFLIDGLDAEMGINHTLDSTDPIDPIQILELGSRQGGDIWRMDGQIAELAVYNSLLSSSEMFDVGSHLGDKYGLTYVPEPGSLALLGMGGLMLMVRRRRG